jgi:integrase
MDMLGHSQIAITMDTYTHVNTELMVEAARQMKDALTA